MKKIFQGMLIGLGKIIPGVSGSVIAISLGIYERAIDEINNFFKHMKKSIVYLLPLGVGITISIIFSGKLIINLLNKYYLPTMLFFLGLIIGGVKDIVKECNRNYTYISIICFLLMFIVSLLSSTKEITFSSYLNQFFFYILVGIIDAITMIIPGISGTAILMMIGCYYTIIKVTSDLTNFSHLVYNFSILLPFALGMMIGIIITIKLVHYLFNNYYQKTYNAILGFSLASIMYMFISTIKSQYNLAQIFIGLLLLCTGYFITKKINHS